MKTYRSKIAFKAVAIGALTDVVATNIWGLVLVLFIFSTHHLFSLPPAQLNATLEALLEGNIVVKIASWVVGGGFTVLGGYVSARIAKKYILLNATLASFLCVIFALIEIASVTSAHELLLAIISVPLNPILALLGGYIYKYQIKNTLIHEA